MAHVILRQLDEKRAEPIPYASRARVQQEPDVLVLIEADLDEVVPGAERPEMIHPLRVIQLGILVDDHAVGRLKLRPYLEMMGGGVAPSAAIILADVMGATVWHPLSIAVRMPSWSSGR